MSAKHDLDLESPRVFISYSQDSPHHEKVVRELGVLLRTQLGIDARLDQWSSHKRRDWSQWAIKQLDKADFVLAIASPGFRDRADGRAPSNEGRGSQFEGAILRNCMTKDRNAWISRILPVVLPHNTVDDIPEFLLPYSATHFVIEHLTPDGIVDLRRALTRQARYRIPPLGKPVPLPPEEATATPPPTARREAGRTAHFKRSTLGTFVMGDYYGGEEGRQ